MFDATGVVAYIVTLHPGILALSALGALLCTAAFALVLTATGAKSRFALSLCFFVGATLVGHVFLSRLGDITPVRFETVRVHGDDLRPAETTRD